MSVGSVLVRIVIYFHLLAGFNSVLKLITVWIIERIAHLKPNHVYSHHISNEYYYLVLVLLIIIVVVVVVVGLFCFLLFLLVVVLSTFVY